MLPETYRIFNPNAPYDSLINFTNRHELLLDHQKKEFLEEVEDFFSKCAYRDELLRTVESLSERMVKYDMPTLERVATQLNWPEGKPRITQLFANIAKVHRITLSQNTPFYQLWLANNEWGWISASYVNSSAKLSACFKEGGQQLNAKPSIPLALQRLQAYTSNKDAKTIVLDLSFEALLDLLVFADEWEVPSLLDDLNELFFLIGMQKPEGYERAVKGFDKQKLDKAMQNMHHRPLKRDRLEGQKVIFPLYEDGQETSCWFKKETPYESIIRFSARCCALSKTEQLRFCSAVRGFFTRTAYCNQRVTLPKAEEGKFTQIALPFLLGTMQHTESERLRLIACIQLVANRQFLLGEPDRVCIISNNYGSKATGGKTEQIGWVPASDVMNATRTWHISLSSSTPMSISAKGPSQNSWVVGQLLKCLGINLKETLAEINILANKSYPTEISTESELKVIHSVAYCLLSQILEKVPPEHYEFVRQMCHVGMYVFDTTYFGDKLKQIVGPELSASTFVEKFFSTTEGAESPFVPVFKELMMPDIDSGHASKIGKQIPLSRENALIGGAILRQCQWWFIKSASQRDYFSLDRHYRYAYLKDEDICTLNDVADIQASQANWMVEFLQREDVKELFRGNKLSNAYPPLLETMKRISQAAPLAEVFLEKFTKHLTSESWRKCLKEMFELICKRNQALSSKRLEKLLDKYQIERYLRDEKFLVKGSRLVNEPNVKEWINSQIGASIQAALSESFDNGNYWLRLLIEVDVFIDKIQGRFKDPARYELLRNFLENHKFKNVEEDDTKIIANIVKLATELTPEGVKEIQNILRDSEAVSLLTEDNLPNLIKLLREHLLD